MTFCLAQVEQDLTQQFSSCTLIKQRPLLCCLSVMKNVLWPRHVFVITVLSWMLTSLAQGEASKAGCTRSCSGLAAAAALSQGSGITSIKPEQTIAETAHGETAADPSEIHQREIMQGTTRLRRKKVYLILETLLLCVYKVLKFMVWGEARGL